MKAIFPGSRFQATGNIRKIPVFSAPCLKLACKMLLSVQSLEAGNMMDPVPIQDVHTPRSIRL